jgi:hypothetical protein
MNREFLHLVATEAAHILTKGTRRDADEWLWMSWYAHGYDMALQHQWRFDLWAVRQAVYDGESEQQEQR